MKSTFGSRRKARKFGQDEADDGVEADITVNSPSGSEQDSTSAEIKRPLSTPRGSHRSRKSSSLRLSFGPGGTSSEDASEDVSEVFTPKKSRLSRQASERNALRKSIVRSSLTVGNLPIRGGSSEDRPSYSKAYLDELRNSTPRTPRELRTPSVTGGEEEDGGSDDPLGVMAKFGVQEDHTAFSSAIPSEAEIREKKERRARLAREQEYIQLEDDDDDDGSNSDSETQLTLRPRSKWSENKEKETRLVREDEDIAEGFDEFVEDGKITLGKKAEQAQSRRKRAEMREMIEEAEGHSDSSSATSDSSEAERVAAYEATQTRAGAYHRPRRDDETTPRTTRPRTPPRITPLPTLSACIERLRSTLVQKQESRARKARELEEIARERAEIALREVEIQKLVKEADEKYRRLKEEADADRDHAAAGRSGSGGSGDRKGIDGSNSSSMTPVRTPMSERGLESFGEGMQVDGDG